MFGKLQGTFYSSPEQTPLGVITGLSLAMLSVWAIFSDDHSSYGRTMFLRINGTFFSFFGIGIAYWYWQMRKWKLFIYSGGIIQIKAWSKQALLWADAIEVVETRLYIRKTKKEISSEMTIVGSTVNISVSTITSRQVVHMFKMIRETARQCSVPTRVIFVNND